MLWPIGRVVSLTDKEDTVYAHHAVLTLVGWVSGWWLYDPSSVWHAT